MIFKVLGYRHSTSSQRRLVRLCWILLSRPEEGLRGFGGLAPQPPDSSRRKAEPDDF